MVDVIKNSIGKVNLINELNMVNRSLQEFTVSQQAAQIQPIPLTSSIIVVSCEFQQSCAKRHPYVTRVTSLFVAMKMQTWSSHFGQHNKQPKTMGDSSLMLVKAGVNCLAPPATP